ncbi:phycocyanobilin Cys-84 alpha-C-phycocyanin lyase, CpcF subunit [Acaryochloris thomasi RCC1774]|uniref:Phycocyanobilin Cys-84 alpha-C-phycocyanin lyase, CpcF subunit n=1 Tax=Acaryochloris thomasi RCC1774 TaxID=1764569 RepID=A0A2W1JNE2_9CYAN|nr:HEAT repeat domain-containing protein [Acaryochloris thomasi]PZD70771.1 phycocyanobilin Cys-84 alpha-C-phycocyanin lyase, CpcF subunit [Acaryochloris thomasi RCC1774]
MADDLASLIEAVDAADSSASLFRAVQNLAGAGLEGAIPTLIAALSYNNPGAAIASVSGLVQLGTASVPAIMAQLDGHNYTARAWAIRALAEIGDPRGMAILLEAATSDFAVSVRRAATKGLGSIQWDGFPASLLQPAQTIALSALLQIAQQDDEWVVRYAAVVGLQQFASHQWPRTEERCSQIQTQLAQMLPSEHSLAVRARVQMAQQHLQSMDDQTTTARAEQPSPLTEKDWTVIRDQLRAFEQSTVGVTLSAIV